MLTVQKAALLGERAFGGVWGEEKRKRIGALGELTMQK